MRCPICGKPASEKYQPFCAKACADQDLGRWLKGDYRIPTEERPALAEPEEGVGEDG
ncbi:MAG: DNA gyrase inhibitor YacG [Pseudomonadota bacterium]